VIALCVHDAGGALGLGIGHVLGDLSFHKLLSRSRSSRAPRPTCPCTWGGPVEPSRGFVLHSPDWGGQDTVLVGMKWAFTGTLDILRAIAEGKGPRQWLVARAMPAGRPGSSTRR
jgi:putative transcriptional regulator